MFFLIPHSGENSHLPLNLLNEDCLPMRSGNSIYSSYPSENIPSSLPIYQSEANTNRTTICIDPSRICILLESFQQRCSKNKLPSNPNRKKRCARGEHSVRTQKRMNFTFTAIFQYSTCLPRVIEPFYNKICSYKSSCTLVAHPHIHTHEHTNTSAKKPKREKTKRVPDTATRKKPFKVVLQLEGLARNHQLFCHQNISQSRATLATAAVFKASRLLIHSLCVCLCYRGTRRHCFSHFTVNGSLKHPDWRIFTSLLGVAFE